MEKWKNIPGLSGHYQASTAGNVKSLNRIIIDKNRQKKSLRGVLLKQTKNKVDGYLYVGLGKGRRTKKVHRLVAETFIPNPKGKPQVNHIDSNKENNHISNLEWVTALENRQHYYAMNRQFKKGVGATRVVNGWIARIAYCNKKYSLGVYKTKRKALEVYKQKYIELTGGVL